MKLKNTYLKLRIHWINKRMDTEEARQSFLQTTKLILSSKYLDRIKFQLALGKTHFQMSLTQI